jgi:hypothetical protein
VFDKSNRTDGTLSRSDFVFDAEQDRYICPEGKQLVQFHRTYATPRSGITKDGTRLYRASKRDCDGCALKLRCCPNTPARKIPRDLDEDARDVARALADTPAYERSRHRRKKVEMLFAHLKRIHAKVAHGGLDLCVAEPQLHRSKISRLAVELRLHGPGRTVASDRLEG